MSISFVIPAKNEEEGIGRTIEFILKQPAELVKEIIVADNGSTDRTAEITANYPKTRVINVPTPGTNLAREAGRKIATGDIIGFIDADNWVTPNWSEVAVKFLSRPGVAAISGPYTYRDQPWIGQLITLWGFIIYSYPVYLLVHSLGLGSVVLGGNVAARSDALEKAGGLDVRYRFFGDDASTGKRLRKVGKFIFTPQLLVSSSSRRFRKRGYVRTLFLYAINFLWTILFDRPYTK